ncbi:hypothetical protein POX_f07546 [Penicillium oxalicum]|uniref:hypothetical protein n=1 Tax=Penicillium oxalicum TaxID=69781 RepID=UPI0020B7AF86|nr:hypothetical protein POX_f07546 [Penicillium oxalicum]KAI2787183.1 hypothetical protein POX_f07546 [Penicillium oxalicum]
MVKARAPKEAKNTKSHLKSRIDFLQQAADYFQQIHQQESSTKEFSDSQSSTSCTRHEIESHSSCIEKDTTDAKPANAVGQSSSASLLSNLSRVYVSHMRGVSLKTQTRLSVPVKRAFCKRCDTLLASEVTCKHEVRNDSRGRRKPWADVLVKRCLTCGTEKRFPQNTKRSKKLSERHKDLAQGSREKSPTEAS